MPYGYHAPYGIFICFLSCRFIDRRNTPIFFAFLPLAFRIHFLPYYQKNTPIFLAFFTFFSLSIPFLTKWHHFPVLCTLFLRICHFKTSLHFCRFLLQAPKMKPYSSPFSAFSIVFTISCLKTCLKTSSPLSKNLKMKPYSSPFPIFASVFFA